MIYDINPCPKPRMTRQDKFRGKPGRLPTRPAVGRYWAFKEEVRLKVGQDVDLDGACIVFYIPMPASWSQKKKEQYFCQPHRQKPDLDNLIKALGDALHDDDSHIASIRATKVWSDTGRIMIKEGCARANEL